jgi:RHS repeat-associated protein
VGSYTFTLIARNGGAEVQQNITLNVVADPITTTRVTGTIADTNQAGLAGVLVELSGYQATTDSSGKFTIVLPESSAGDTLKIYGQRIQGGGITYPFIAEKMGLLLGHDIYRGVNNQIDRPIYLPTVDVTTGTTVNPSASTVVSNPKLAGAQVTVAANSLFDKSGNAFAGIMSITEVPTSLTPAALPENLHPDLVVTIQPGDMVFNTAARLTLPNKAGYKAGLVMDLWSINPNTGLFDIVGKGKVSADGSVIETISGGIRNSSWHFFSDPGFTPGDPNVNPYNATPGCPGCAAEGGINSEVAFQTGEVTETHNLATYQSLGTTRGISLSYNSLRADARPILHFNYDNVDPNVYSVPDALRLVAKLKLTGNDNFSYQVPGYAGGNNLTGGENFWKLPAGGGKVDAALQMDLRAQASGQYDYTLNSGILGYAGSRGYIGSTADSTGKIIIVNSVNSAFGSGWNLNGLQEIVKNKDGSVLLIDGNGQELLFQAAPATPGTYTNPTGDFSTLKQLGDGTFERTLKDGTVYLFNANNQLADMKDRQGNQTQYRYDPTTGKLTQMVDPTGLTTFNYTGNRITSIVDPIGRTTKMEYDTKGNLTKITDPDGTYRQWEYDADHHLTAAIDKAGGRGEDFYDFAGRAYKGIRPDGSVVQVNPVEVQGLYRPDLTSNPNTAPIATALAAKPVATYLDGNGNPLVDNIDKFGQATAAKDGVGKLSTTERNSTNLVTTTTSATGGKIDYTYDERGNVIATNEQIVQPGLTQFSQWTPQTPVSFNGQNSYVSLSNSGLVSNSTNSTVEMWLKLDQLGNTRQSLYSEDNTGGVTFEISYNSGFLEFGVWRTDVASNWRTISAPFGYKDEWVHVTSVLDATKGMQLYVNGTLVAANTDPRPSNATQISSSLGRFSNGGGGAYFNGEIGDVRLWNTARSTQQIQADIKGGNLTGQEAGLVGYWQFKEESGTKITDLTSNGRNAQLKGSATWDNNPTPNVPQQLVYSNDFETLAGAEWSSNQVEGSVPALTKFLGRFGNDPETLTLDTTPGETYKLNFDFYTIDSWDGTSGSDYFNVAIDGTQVFHNSFSAFSANDQTFRAPDRLENFGFAPYANWPEGIYRGIPLTFTATGNTTKISFAGSNLSPQYDESWGIDNVRVNQLTGLIPAAAPINVQRQYTYDTKFNQLTSVTDELGHKTLYDLDNNTGNVIKTTRVVGQLDSTINSETNDVVTSYTYTSTGQLDLVTDALLHITDYDYDTYGNLTKTTTAKGTLDQIVEEYEYDLAGNRTATIDALKHKTKYIYNSTNMLLQTIDPLGGTTTYNYDKMGHQTRVIDALGHETNMTYDSRGRLISTLAANDATITNSYDNNGNLVEVRRQKSADRSEDIVTQYKYDARNRLTGTIAADGGTSTTKYDLNNNPLRSTDSLGHLTQQVYDSRNRLVKATDALGNVTKYTYNAVNQLITTTDAKEHTTSYQYDELGRQIATTDALQHSTRTEYDKLGNVTATIDLNGNRTEYTYDALNRRTQVKNAQNKSTYTVYDKVGNVLSVTDALNRTTNYGYDDLNRQTSRTNALNQTTATTYNKVGNILTITDPIAGHTTSYGYDKLNRKISTTDALNQTQTITYNILGNVSSTTDSLGRTTKYEYDKVDRLTTTTDALLHTTKTSYDKVGNILTTSDGLENQTSYLYDKNNRRIQVTDAKGGTTKTGYDAVGNVVTTTDALERTTKYGYDEIDRRISTTDALNQTNTTSYDAVGNTIASTDRLGRTTTSSYDNLNRRISTTDVLGQTKSVTYDEVSRVLNSTNELGQITSYGYDLLDRKTSITDALGNTSTTSYDAVGNITITTDEIGNSTRYIYDNLNRRVQTIDAKGGVSKTSFNAVGNVEKITDSVNNSTTYTYDAANRLTAETNQLGKTRTHNYDAVGNQIDTIDRNGRKIAYNYDVLNRQTTENWLDDNNTIIKTFAYIYDAVGHLLTSTNPDSKYTYTYDAIDRLTSIDNVGTVGVPAVKFGYNYDAVGNIIAVTDRINNINAGITTYTYDLLNRVTQLTQSGNGVQTKQVSMVYNALDRITNLTRYSGNSNVAATNYLYDNNQRLIKLTHQKGANTIANYDYTYDAADKLNKTVSSSDGTSDYSYDATNQLTGTDNSTQTDEAYSYDANGNRTAGGYQTGVNNQLLADGSYKYEYDGEGNRTKRTEIATGKITEYSWDYRNRLTTVLFKDASSNVLKTIEYLYDGNNQRIAKKINGAVTERYVIDRNQIALVFDAVGSQTHRYLYGAGVDQVLADETGTSMVWALTDRQGTVKDLIDNGGNIIEHLTYDSFGKLSNASTTGFRYGYTGREQDSETGLDYYRARYYDSANGRFISEDPIGFAAGDTNLTRYVGNSPTNGTDPSGLCIFRDNLLTSINIRVVTAGFNKYNYYPSPTEALEPPSPGWRSYLVLVDSLRPTEHSTKFMDYYFADGFLTAGKRDFNLGEQGILDSIKSIPAIKKETDAFNKLMQSRIKGQLNRCKNNKPSCLADFKLTTPGIVGFLEEETIHPNLTLAGNFTLGHTTIKMSGTFKIDLQTCAVSEPWISYKLTDTFDDAADLLNCTNPRQFNEELIGGVGYKIVGNWKEKIGGVK